MRWWARLLLTVALVPALWQLFTAYIASQQGASWGDLLTQSVSAMAGMYLIFTVPALALCGLLIVSDSVLGAVRLALLTIVVSPLLAWLAAIIVLRFLPHVSPEGRESAIALAIFYGTIWGLTLREPRTCRARSARHVPAATELDRPTLA